MKEMYDGTEKAEVVTPMSALDTAVEQCYLAQERLDEIVSHLVDRLHPVMRPEPPDVPMESTTQDASLHAVRRQPSLVVERLLSHVTELEQQARRLDAINERLDT